MGVAASTVNPQRIVPHLISTTIFVPISVPIFFLVFLSILGGFLAMGSSAKALSFDHEMASKLPPTRVWGLLSAALSGDQENGLWPTRYSTISGQVAEGGHVTEVVFGWSQIHYRLSDVVVGKRLTYSPRPGEPMVGRSHIEIHGTPDGGSIVHWFGSYGVSALSPRGIVLRLYEQLFFFSFERNLRRIARREGF